MSIPGPQQYPDERPTAPIPAQLATPSRPGGARGVLWAVLAVLVLLLFVPYFAQQISFAIARGKELARAEVARGELAKLPDTPVRYPAVAKIIEPSVVGIEAKLPASRPMSDVWWWFEPQVRAMAQGSGVIVDKEGYILTNAHVIGQSSPGGVTVQLNDGRTVSAKVVGVDPGTDIAVLKIDVAGLTAADWGDSDALEVGDAVLAVGSPYGLRETVTAGIISAKNRNLPIENVSYEGFLQTDAAVNPGNSGGPLINTNAQLVGINTAIVGHAYQGIGFAIPSNMAKTVYESLRTQKKIARGWIGVRLQDLNAGVAEKLGLSDTRGAAVVEVEGGSPADRAGLKAGDVIVAWQGRSIANSIDLRIAVARTKPGTQAIVTFYRDGKKQEGTITVAQRPNQLTQ